MGQSTKIPWDEIRLEYVHDPLVSLRKIARQHGVHHTTVVRRAKKERWEQQRLEFVDELATKHRQKATTKLANLVDKLVRQTLGSTEELRRMMMEQVRRGAAPEITGDTVVEESRGPGGKRVTRSLQRHKLTLNDPIVQRVFQREGEILRLLMGEQSQVDIRHYIHAREVKGIVEQIFKIICEEMEDTDARRRVAEKLQRLSLGAGGSAGQLPHSDTLAIHAQVVEGGAS